MNKNSGRFGLLIALALHLVLSSAYLLTTPVGEAPDEQDYVWGIWLMERTWSLPLAAGTANYLNRPELASQESNMGHQPPLYYVILAGCQRLFLDRDLAPTWHDNPDYLGREGGTSPHKDVHGWDERRPTVSAEVMAFWAMRGLSVLCGLVLVWGGWALGRLFQPDRPGIAAATALVVACLPQFSFNFAILDSGNLAAALALPAFIILLRVAKAGTMGLGEGISCGLLIGLAVMAKLTALYMPAAAGLALIWTLCRRRQMALPLLKPAALAGLIIVALSGWFFIRNLYIYGDLTGESPKLLAFAGNQIPSTLVMDHLLGPFLPLAWHSFIGNFGWVCQPIPFGLAWSALAFPLLALLGWLSGGKGLLTTKGTGRALVLGLLCTLISAGLLLRYNLRYYQPQGRYIFPVLPFISLVTVMGIYALLDKLTTRRTYLKTPIGLTLIGLWISFGIGVFLFSYRPHAAPEKPTATPLDACLTFGLCTPPGANQPKIRLTAPAPGTRCTTPPTFRWELPAEFATRTVSIHLVYAKGYPIGSTHEWLRLPLKGNSWTIPQPFWDALRGEEEIRWKVRVVPDRSRGESSRQMPESGFQNLMKVTNKE